MTQAPDDPAAPTPEQQLGEWATSTGETTWQIDVDTESAGQARPNADAGQDPQAPDDPEGGRRLRRPSSLRTAGDSSSTVPRRRLDPPPFPGPAASNAGPPAAATTGPAAEASPTAPNTPGAVSDSGPTQVEKLAALVKERPEAGLGIAFVGGLVIATLLKRIANR